jgi:surface antigen
MSDTPDDNTPAQPISDGLIMQHADGVLPPDLRPAVMDALARDPALMQRFESFLFTRGPLARAFDPVLAAPIPEALLEIVRGPAPSRSRPTASLFGSPRLARLAEMFRLPEFSPAVAIPAVLVGVAAGWLAHLALGVVAPTDGRVVADAASIQHALEVTATGGSTKIAHDLSLMPRFTFATDQKVWCRQYALMYGDGLQAGGVACRKPDGVWQVLMSTPPAPSVRTPDAHPAGKEPGGSAPPSNESVLDGVRALVKEGDVLGREAEADLIKGGWRTP